MLCSQALASYLQAGHPSFPVVTADSGPRNKKWTLQRRFNPAVASYMNRDGTNADATSAKKDTHTSAVADSIQVRRINRVLGLPAPPVNGEVEELLRKARRTLAQQRSGYCHSLNDYGHQVGLSDSNICLCCFREHNSTHFQMP